MAQIASMEGKGNGRVSRQSMFSSFWDWFSSLHKFDKLFLITLLLLIIATPTIVGNYMSFSPEAAKGGSAGKVTISLVQTDGSNPNFGESIQFAVDRGALTAPAVIVTCSQNGGVVYGESHGIASGFSGPFTLGPTSVWTGGAADCVAQVWETYQNAKLVRGASVSFHVDP